MHAFLVFCVLAEAAIIGILIWFVRGLSIGADAGNGRMDEIIARLALIPEGVTETNWAEICATLYRHTDEFASLDGKHADFVRQSAITAEGLGNSLGALRLRVSEIHTSGYQRAESMQSTLDTQAELLNQLEGKLTELIEGCAKMDVDLSTTVDDVRECADRQQENFKKLTDSITEIADAQEKARRKSGLRSAPSAFESLRSVAESGARGRADPERDKLVSLAEGRE